MARSYNYLPYWGPKSPEKFVNIGMRDFDLATKAAQGLLVGAPLEIHQFGMLGERPIPDWRKYIDMGTRAAAWEFQTLFRFRTAGLSSITHWDTFNDLPCGSKRYPLATA